MRKSALYEKAHSGAVTSRKGALWGRDVTKRCTLVAGLLRAATYDLLKNA